MPAPGRPKLGQHFLTSPGYRQRIIAALPLRPDDLVVEIGPGRGAMTQLLAERARRVIGIELDRRLARELNIKLSEDPDIVIREADFLSVDLAALCREHQADSCFIFGNLPYYITSPIIHHLMDSAKAIHGMALLVQREVAERLTARPGSRNYGYLTVVAHLHSEPQIALTVPPGAFSPPPKVLSALVEFRMRPKFADWSAQERARFLEFIKSCFGHKRKNLVNNLGAIYGRDQVHAAIESVGLTAKARAEETNIDRLSELFRMLV